MVRIVRFHEAGGPEVLRLEQVAERDPGPGEIRIRVEAIGLNRAEVMLREGVYHERPVFPSRIGYEAAGVVDALGAGVTTVKEGERVATVPSFALSQTRHGVCGESAVVPAEVVQPYPASLSPPTARLSIMAASARTMWRSSRRPAAASESPLSRSPGSAAPR
jgi:NADPH:quinone reductase-like Zn-dependent oxidoreductase